MKSPLLASIVFGPNRREIQTKIEKNSRSSVVIGKSVKMEVDSKLPAEVLQQREECMVHSKNLSDLLISLSESPKRIVSRAREDIQRAENSVFSHKKSLQSIYSTEECHRIFTDQRSPVLFSGKKPQILSPRKQVLRIKIHNFSKSKGNYEKSPMQSPLLPIKTKDQSKSARESQKKLQLVMEIGKNSKWLNIQSTLNKGNENIRREFWENKRESGKGSNKSEREGSQVQNSSINFGNQTGGRSKSIHGRGSLEKSIVLSTLKQCLSSDGVEEDPQSKSSMFKAQSVLPDSKTKNKA